MFRRKHRLFEADVKLNAPKDRTLLDYNIKAVYDNSEDGRRVNFDHKIVLLTVGILNSNSEHINFE